MKERLFIAINLDEETRRQLRKQLALIKKELCDRSIRWLPAEKWHFTLAFLGEMETVKIPALQTIISQVSRQFRPFMIKLTGLGYFPNINRPRILWIGGQAEELKKIVQLLRQNLAKNALIYDRKPFQAHLTVAKLKNPPRTLKERLKEIEQRYRNHIFGQFTAESIELMESTLDPTGSLYASIYRKNFCA